MIINEKQILHLIKLTYDLRDALFYIKTNMGLNDKGENVLLDCESLIKEIISQQPEGLNEIS